jgi:hypothetical protein
VGSSGILLARGVALIRLIEGDCSCIGWKEGEGGVPVCPREGDTRKEEAIGTGMGAVGKKKLLDGSSARMNITVTNQIKKGERICYVAAASRQLTVGV